MEPELEVLMVQRKAGFCPKKSGSHPDFLDKKF